MTKRKAIEAALLCYDGDGDAEALADRAYEQGRIAGLREAAKLWVVTPEACRERANVLAKKARVKVNYE